MDRLFGFLLLAVASLLLLSGCEPGTVTAPQGAVRGVVLVEGASLGGVIVELTGPQVRSVTTDEAGRYVFESVPSGAYVVSIRSVPNDASFPATSRTAVVSGIQTVTVDFLGNYIRTASIQGTVTSGSQGLSGIVVTLSGAQSGTTLTGSGGAFVFSGLRAGSYQVEISGLPEAVTFPSVRTDVELSSGQTFLVTFEGVPELTASVVIRSIARRLPDGTAQLADPQNLLGELEVTVTVDRGEDTLVAVDLLLGDELVGRQSFQAGGEDAADPASSPQPQAPLDIVFSVNTSEYDDATGAVRFPNGQSLLSTRLATTEGGSSAWISSVQVQLRNLNTFTGSLEPERGPTLGEDGEEWIGGDLSIRVHPVLFDSSRPVGSVTIDLRRTGGSQQRLKGTIGTPPFPVVLEGEVAPAGNNVAAYQTPTGAVDQIRVVSAQYTDGTAVPGVPAILAEGLRIDNVGPAPANFSLPRQSDGQACCLGNWVGAAFPFQEAVSVQPDAGVGGVSTTVHVGASGLSDAELLGLPAVTVGADLDPTDTNSDFRAVVVSRDALENSTVSALAPSEGNSLSNALGAVLGVDLEAPQLGFDVASVRDRAKNPPTGATWVLSVVDATSGAGPLAARTSVRLLNSAVAGTPAQCLFPGSGECEPAQDALLRGIPGGVEGYLSLRSRVLDRGGNASNEVARSVVRDGTTPGITSIQVPGTLMPSGQTTFSALATDNLDLHEGWIALEFGDPGSGGPDVAPPQAAQILGVPFDDELRTQASLTQTFPLLIGMERVAESGDADVPTGTVLPLTAARAVITDAAGNLISRSEPLPAAAGLETRSFSVQERGGAEGVADWSLEAAADRVCRSDRVGECGPGIASSVGLVATARGLGGSLQSPFDRVYFYRVRSGEPQWIGVALVAAMTDGQGPLGRAWSWSLGWTPDPTVSLGPVTLVAVGVDGSGNTLRTVDLASVSVEGGP